ncbi:EamA family transporter [Streptomyces sp. NBC_01390]|uniref:hypothetical protein n=1 Tax=Streptomyces sp. NBC_01390 TaxID=2903850 RepID=UPI003247EE44
MSAPLYSTFTSLVCGMELLAVCRLADIPLTGFDRSTQLSLLGLLLLPQILGLGSLNFVLGRTSATTMSVLLLLETPVAALAARWFMDQNLALARIPGLLLIIVDVTVVVTSGGEQLAPAPDEHGVAIPRPAYPPHIPQPRSVTMQLTLPRHIGRTPGRDPRLDWARHTESPTVTLTYHEAGAFDTLHMRKPRRKVQEEPFTDDPTVTLTTPARQR